MLNNSTRRLRHGTIVLESDADRELLLGHYLGRGRILGSKLRSASRNEKNTGEKALKHVPLPSTQFDSSTILPQPKRRRMQGSVFWPSLNGATQPFAV